MARVNVLPPNGNWGCHRGIRDWMEQALRAGGGGETRAVWLLVAWLTGGCVSVCVQMGFEGQGCCCMDPCLTRAPSGESPLPHICCSRLQARRWQEDRWQEGPCGCGEGPDCEGLEAPAAR